MTRATWKADDIGDQSGRRIIVTGATSGIGKEAARVLAMKNATVIIAARNLQKAAAIVDEILGESPGADVSARELDLSSLASVKTFAESIIRDFDSLDALTDAGGIQVCGNAQNCVAVCPKEIPLTTSIARAGRATTLHTLKKWFGR